MWSSRCTFPVSKSSMVAGRSICTQRYAFGVVYPSERRHVEKLNLLTGMLMRCGQKCQRAIRITGSHAACQSRSMMYGRQVRPTTAASTCPRSGNEVVRIESAKLNIQQDCVHSDSLTVVISSSHKASTRPMAWRPSWACARMTQTDVRRNPLLLAPSSNAI